MTKRALAHTIKEAGHWQIDAVILARNIVDLLNELQDDHATRKTARDAIETLIEELHDDSGTVATWDAEVDADLDTINDYTHFLNERDGVIDGDFAITAGAATTLTGAGRVYYRIGGIDYCADVDTTIDLEDSGDVTQNKFGAWRVLIDRAGTVTTLDTAGSGGMAHDSEEEALFSLSQRAITANTVEIGYLSTTKTGSAFNIGTDNLNVATQTAVVYTVHGPRLQCGFNVSQSASPAFAVDNTVKTWDTTGTIDARIVGKVSSSVIRSGNLAQISAITDQAMADADTVGIAQFGGWLMCTDVAGTGIVAIASDGIHGAVSAMTHANAADRNTALDDVQNRLPAIFAPVGRILLENVGGGNAWVAITDDWDHDTAVATVVNYTFGELDRTALVGDVGRNAPTAPSTIAAPLTPAVSSSKPASGPATLTDSTNLVLTAG